MRYTYVHTNVFSWSQFDDPMDPDISIANTYCWSVFDEHLQNGCPSSGCNSHRQLASRSHDARSRRAHVPWTCTTASDAITVAINAHIIVFLYKFKWIQVIGLVFWFQCEFAIWKWKLKVDSKSICGWRREKMKKKKKKKKLEKWQKLSGQWASDFRLN